MEVNLIQVANIEEELQRLWDEQKKKKQLKACLFNLIIYTHEPRRTAYFRKMVDTIIEKFPCRIIFIEGNTEASNHLRATVSAETTGLIACDQITIETSFDELHRVPFLVIPHLVPDLPIYLLWGQDPTLENAIFPKLHKFATRLIFDSECTEDLQHFSLEMLKKMDQLDIEFMDMHWALVRGWREAMRQVFDTREKMHMLSISKEIQIFYNDRKTPFFTHYETQAIYLQGWLAAQMNWQFEKREKSQIHYNGITVSLCPQEHPTHPPGAILGIEVTTKNDDHFSIKRQESWSKAIVHVTYQDKCELPFILPLPDLNRGLTFMQEIFFSQPGKHYKNMLQMIAKTPW